MTSISGFTADDVTEQSGKTFLVTGANTGIGFGAAKVLAKRGGRVLLGCRSPERGEEAARRIVAAHPAADVAVVAVDLADLGSVRAAADRVADEDRLDVLINNAGLLVTSRQLTADGFEYQFGVNHLGHFALTGLLLQKLEAANHGRVVTISSIAHRRGTILFDDLDASSNYDPRQRYAQSKLANLLFTYELERRLRATGASTIAVAAHPGGAMTDFARDMGLVFRTVGMRLMGLLANSADAGAWPTLAASTHPDVAGGQYFGPGGIAEVRGPATVVGSSGTSNDPALAKRLWEVSVDMTGIDPGI